MSADRSVLVIAFVGGASHPAALGADELNSLAKPDGLTYYV